MNFYHLHNSMKNLYNPWKLLIPQKVIYRRKKLFRFVIVTSWFFMIWPLGSLGNPKWFYCNFLEHFAQQKHTFCNIYFKGLFLKEPLFSWYKMFLWSLSTIKIILWNWKFNAAFIWEIQAFIINFDHLHNSMKNLSHPWKLYIPQKALYFG